MNFDSIATKQVHDGYTLEITGKYYPDTLSRILQECGSGDNRQGEIMCFIQKGHEFVCDIFCF